MPSHTTDPQTSKPTSKPYYGWVVLGVCMLATVATSPGQSFLVGLVNDPIRNELGLSATRLASAYGIATFTGSLLLNLVGRIADRFGVRWTTAYIALAFACGCFVTARASGFWSILAAFFMLRFLGQGALGLLASHAPAMWFERRLGFVEGLRHGSMSLAVILLPPLFAFLITDIGWRNTYVASGAVVLIVSTIAAALLRNRPEDVGQHLDNDPYEHDPTGDKPPPKDDPAFTLSQATATPAFWILSVSALFSGVIGTAYIFQPTLLLSELGADPAVVPQMLQGWGLAFGITTFAAGKVIDTAPPRLLLAASNVVLSASAAMMLVAGLASWVPIAAMSVFGLAQAFMMLTVGPTTARYFGRTHHGSIRGFQTTLSVAGTAAGPVIFAAMFDATGSFRPVLIGTITLAGVLAAAGLVLRRPPPLTPKA